MAEGMEELRTMLKNDWKSRYRKYPDLAIFAISDPRVAAALEERFKKDDCVKAIKSLHYDFYTGLNSIYFEFVTNNGNSCHASRDAILVMLDGRCNVMGLKDPFDPAQPNPAVPPLPNEGELPFVLYQSSEVDANQLGEQETFPEQVRSREFFLKLKAGGSNTNWPPTGFIGTINTYWTHTLLCKDARSDTEMNDCGPDTILT